MTNFKKFLLASILPMISYSAYANDHFLSGFKNSCNHSKSYQTFQKKLCKPTIDKDGNEHCLFGSITLPTHLNSLVIDHKLTNNVESTFFEINLKPGLEFAHNKIVGIEQWTGHSNGIWGTALVTDSKNLESVNRNIKNSGLKIHVLKDTDIGDIGMVVAKGEDGYVRLVCDVSN